MSRGRKVSVWALVVLASLVAFLSIMTTWVTRQMLDSHSWHKASTQVIQDPAVRSALATQLVNELYANVDISGELAQRLPNNLKRLADPAAAALREPATQGVEYLLAQPRFQQLFVNASDLAHEKLVNVLENKTGFGIQTGNGVVTLDVTELLKQIGQELGLPGSVLDKLPTDAGTITIMQSDQLAAAQKGVRLTRILSVWLLVLVLAIYVAAMALAVGERRKTLAHIGWGLVIVGILVLIARRLIGNYVISSLVDETYRTPGHHIWLIATSILGQIGWAAVMYGLLAVLGAMIAGPWRAAVALRREIAPALNQRQGIVWGGAAILYLLLVLWGPTHALRTWWGILLIAALFAGGIYALRLQTLQEFPDAGLAPPEHTMGERIGSLVRGAEGHLHRPSSKPAGERTASEEIARLYDLKEKGALSEAEFEQAKKLALT